MARDVAESRSNESRVAVFECGVEIGGDAAGRGQVLGGVPGGCLKIHCRSFTARSDSCEFECERELSSM